VIDNLADSAISDDLTDRFACGDRLEGELIGGARAFDETALAARGDDKGAFVVLVDDLRQPHIVPPRNQRLPLLV
jgi:hypothetical protein